MESEKSASVRPGPGADQVNVGTIVAGKYRLDACLGSGGMGTVWSCTHLVLGERMAIKIVSTSTALSREVRARFAREARASARLKSRFSVHVFDCGELPHGTPYIVMEYLAGETLRQHLRRVTRLPLGETVGILTQVARGLERAHEAGIVHRDIKPDNIFLAQTSDDGLVAKVFDFGVAKLVDAANATETIEGTFIGTPQFMSPEQAMGRPDVDHRTDVYSLGVLAYRMLTGRGLYDATSIPALLFNICNGPLPLLRDLAPDTPPDVEIWFQKTCAREREERFASASECAEALLVAAGMSTSKLLMPDSYQSGTHLARTLSQATPVPATRVSSSSPAAAPMTVAKRGSLDLRVAALVVATLAVLVSALLLLRTREPHVGESRNGAAPAVRAGAITDTEIAHAAPTAAPSAPPAGTLVPNAVSAVEAAPTASAPAPPRSVWSRPAYPTAQTLRPALQLPAPKHQEPAPTTPPQPTKSANGAITDVGY
ncbi:MAG: serine/threonine-protein kinase [Polyangiaceae bacterium]|jgi:serine/threonine-protein kinase